MNKSFFKIVTLILGLALAGGVGTYLANNKTANSAFAMSDDYTVGTEKLTSVTDGMLVAWGIEDDNLATGINSSNWVTLSGTKANWLVFEIEEGTDGFYLKSGTNYVYSSAVKKVAFDSTHKTLMHLEASGLVAADGIGYYVYNSSGLRPYASAGAYAESYLYEVTYHAAVDITSISEITLSHSSIALNSKEKVTATATVNPDNANEKIKWKSNDESVATIAASSTYGVADITLVGEGEVTFTAEALHDSAISATSLTLIVTPAVALHTYDVTFPGNGAIDSSVALNTTTIHNAVEGDVNELTFSSINNVFSGKNETLKLGASSGIGSLTIASSSSNIKTVILEASTFGDDSTKMKVTLGEGTPSVTTLTTGFVYYTFDSESPVSQITIAGNQASKNRFYVRSIYFLLDTYVAEQGAYIFAASFLNDTAEQCSALSVTSEKWGEEKTLYNTIKTSYEGSDTLLKGSSSDEDGNVVAQALARYDFIANKYSEQGFENFIDRELNSAVTQYVVESDNNATIVVVISISFALISFAGLMIFRKKRIGR